jgi:hypothetical protein
MSVTTNKEKKESETNDPCVSEHYDLLQIIRDMFYQADCLTRFQKENIGHYISEMTYAQEALEDCDPVYSLNNKTREEHRRNEERCEKVWPAVKIMHQDIIKNASLFDFHGP